MDMFGVCSGWEGENRAEIGLKWLHSLSESFGCIKKESWVRFG